VRHRFELLAALRLIHDKRVATVLPTILACVGVIACSGARLREVNLSPLPTPAALSQMVFRHPAHDAVRHRLQAIGHVVMSPHMEPRPQARRATAAAPGRR
jgi:hypothetical protein